MSDLVHRASSEGLACTALVLTGPRPLRAEVVPARRTRWKAPRKSRSSIAHMPPRPDRSEAFRDLVGEQAAPGALRKLLAQRQIGQRIERVVEIDEQFAPLHACHVRARAQLQARHRKLIGGA